MSSQCHLVSLHVNSEYTDDATTQQVYVHQHLGAYGLPVFQLFSLPKCTNLQPAGYIESSVLFNAACTSDGTKYPPDPSTLFIRPIVVSFTELLSDHHAE